MKISLRLEEERDHMAVESLTREAFWDLYRPGCFEHMVVHNIRKVPAFVKELCYVACDGDTAVGNIVYSKAKVVDEDNREFEVLSMGPVAVLPSYQKKGIGTQLIDQSLKAARDLGFRAVLLFGSPQFYARFGFVNAKEYGITTSSGENIDPFMALELFAGALEGIAGRYYEDPVFEVKQEEVADFDKGFPYKEKHVLDTQIFR